MTDERARIEGWRMKAEELRAAAETMTDPAARIGMLNAARSYEHLAANAEARLTGTTRAHSEAG